MLRRQAIPEETKRQAENELRRQLVLVGQGRALADGPFAAMNLATAQSVLRALKNVGAVNESEANRWDARFEAEANPEPGRTFQINANAVPQVQAIRTPRNQKGQPPKDDGSIVRRLSRPISVLAVENPPDAEVAIRSIELYTDGVVVLSTLVAGLEEGITNWLQATLNDNCETSYRHVMAQGHSNRWEHAFTPAVPSGASTLNLVIGKDSFEVRLRG